jgi:hypothetical protein
MKTYTIILPSPLYWLVKHSLKIAIALMLFSILTITTLVIVTL